MPARGWQMVSAEPPQCWFQLFDDSIRREGNRIHFTFNVAARTGNMRGAYWDYEWFVNVKVFGASPHPVSFTGKKIKPKTAFRRVILGKEFFMSQYSGFVTGSVDIDKAAQGLNVLLEFYDTNRNTGSKYWWLPIPVASAPSELRKVEERVKPDGAYIKFRAAHPGHLSQITKWRFEYGETPNYGQWSESQSSSLEYVYDQQSGLKDNTTYYYKVTVTNSLGFTTSYSDSFRTPLANIGVERKTSGDRNLKGYIVYPNGKISQIIKVKKVSKR